ncbi:hypothetical protein NL676_020110 [Syzygium grande]|nr:hypothetical protein NL676_020110 [Syzygium grande]
MVPQSPQHQKQPPFMGATVMATSTSTSSTNRDNLSGERLDRTPWWTSDPVSHQDSASSMARKLLSSADEFERRLRLAIARN